MRPNSTGFWVALHLAIRSMPGTVSADIITSPPEYCAMTLCEERKSQSEGVHILCAVQRFYPEQREFHKSNFERFDFTSTSRRVDNFNRNTLTVPNNKLSILMALSQCAVALPSLCSTFLWRRCACLRNGTAFYLFHIHTDLKSVADITPGRFHNLNRVGELFFSIEFKQNSVVH